MRLNACPPKQVYVSATRAGSTSSSSRKPYMDSLSDLVTSKLERLSALRERFVIRVESLPADLALVGLLDELREAAFSTIQFCHLRKQHAAFPLARMAFEAAQRVIVLATDDDYERELCGKHVLIVDDNDTNRWVLHEQLATWGMRGGSCAGGEQALKALRIELVFPRPTHDEFRGGRIPDDNRGRWVRRESVWLPKGDSKQQLFG
jgi:hypothetical protein